MTARPATAPAGSELVASRTRILQGRDAERRQIERALHDGVQQGIVALVAKLGLVRSMLDRDPSRTQKLIEELQVEALHIIDDLRDLAYGIYPSVLGDAGLVAAVEFNARRMPIPVTVTASTGLRETRFAVEVAESAFYVVAEALTNVLKHARATRVMINLAPASSTLEIEVQDNGVGLPASVRAGRGLTALRDRVETIGGMIKVGNVAGGGALIRARIPLRTSV